MGNLNREGKQEIRAPKLLMSDQVLYHITLTGVSSLLIYGEGLKFNQLLCTLGKILLLSKDSDSFS